MLGRLFLVSFLLTRPLRLRISLFFFLRRGLLPIFELMLFEMPPISHIAQPFVSML